jgi:hypothetical protein
LFFNLVVLCNGILQSLYVSRVYGGQYSIKFDVFSFGVLVLELLSGKENKGFCHPNHHLNLIGHVSINNAVIDKTESHIMPLLF